MIRKSLKGILFLLIIVMFIIYPDMFIQGAGGTAYAEELKSGNYKYELLEDGTVWILGYIGKATNVKFPSTLAGRKVTRIESRGHSIFEDNHKDKVVSAVIPEGIIKIGDTFNGCAKLKSVILPKSLLRIETDFGNCTSLTEIKLPPKLEYIGRDAFWGCAGLREINIPDSVVEMGDRAFYHCTNLKKIKLSKNVPVVDLYGCEFLTNLTIPNGVNEVYLSEFSRLNKLKLPGSLRKLGIGNNDSLESFTIQEGVKVISLWDCNRLVKVNIPSSAVEVVLKYCTKIKSIRLPNTLTYIKDDAFLGCKSLEDINIPGSVRSVGENSLFDTAWYNKQKDGLIYKDKWCIAYKGDRTKVKSLSFANGTKGIADGLTAERMLMVLPDRSLMSDLRPFDTIKEIMLPDSVEIIGRGSFSYCENLTSITLSPNIKVISAFAFAGCSKLKSIVLPDSVETIEERAFIGCTNLTSVKFSKKLKIIEPGAFVSCSKMRSIVLPDSLEVIGRDMRDDEQEDFFGVFTGCESLTSITLSKNLKLIGYRTFEDCVNLKNIVLPNKLGSIGGWAFKGCVKLDTFVLPKSIQHIGEEAFENTAWMKKQKKGVIYKEGWIIDYKGTMPDNCSVTIKEGTIGLSDYALAEKEFTTKVEESGYKHDISRQKLKKVSVPDTVRYIGKGAFANSGLESIILTGNIERLDKTFLNCSELKKVQLPESIRYIGESTFMYCDNLTTINFPEELLDIGDLAFYGCAALKDIKIPNKLQKIGILAFYGCRSLPGSVIFPKSMISVGEEAFYECWLDSVAVLNKDMKIGSYAFGYKASLLLGVGKGYGYKKISDMKISGYSSSTVEKYAKENEFEFIEINKEELKPLEGTKIIPLEDLEYEEFGSEVIITKYRGAGGTEVLVLPRMINYKEVTIIGDGAFSECSTLTGIILSKGIKRIGSSAFYKCSNLSRIEMPESITEIGEGAFSKCSGLSSIMLSKEIDSIGSFAFNECRSLTSITIPERVTSINMNTFSGCSALTNITIPKGMKSIYSGAFSGCISLRSIEIPENVMLITEYVFSRCSALTSITIPKGVKTIDEGVFSGCSNLRNIEMPESVTFINDYAFADCTGLTNLVIPKGVTRIGEDIFGMGEDIIGNGCVNLSSVTFLGECPERINDSPLPPGCTVYYKQEHAASWESYNGKKEVLGA